MSRVKFGVISACVLWSFAASGAQPTPLEPFQPDEHTLLLPGKPVARKTVRKPRVTGVARLSLRLKRLYGGSAAGWVAFKSPGKPAVFVGRYDLSGVADQAETRVEFDVSDEWSGSDA